MVELSYDIVHLLFFLGSLFLHHLNIFLIALLLFSDLGLVIFNHGVIPLLGSFSLFLKSSFESVTLNLEEVLQLAQLLFRFLSSFLKSLLKVEGLLFKFTLKLKISLLSSIFLFFDHS